jgi:uncharacterized SAM-binding protein YcdF (DUF218 family)
MFILISKLVLPLVEPLGLISLLWLAAALCYWRGFRQWGRGIAAGGIAAVMVFANPLVGERLLGALEGEYPIRPAAELPVADAVVVLGGVTEPPIPPRRTVEVGAGFDRLLHGMRLLREGRGRYLVLCGGSIPQLTGAEMTEAVQMRNLALEWGVPSAAILLEEQSRNTYENALYSRILLEERGLEQILLVTSAAHMRRAAACFRRQGLEVVPAPADVRVVARPLSPARLLPTLWGLECSTAAVKEYVGWWVYRLRGWI